MVNPIGSNPVSLPAGPVALNIERPANLPDPARQVTAAADTPNLRDSAQAGQEQKQDTPSSLDKVLDQLNSSMQAWSTGMRFNVDEDSKRVVISIVDSSTGEVLRTVPSDAVLRAAKMIVQLQGQAISTKV